MSRTSGFLQLFRRWCAACVLVLIVCGTAAAGDDTRFSNMLNAAEKASAGVAKLTSDQVAVLDALYRRDTAKRGSTVAPKSNAEAAPAEFSRRLSADERRNTGIASLTEAEVAKLDALVERQQNAQLVRVFLAPPPLVARRDVRTEAREERRIHGSFTLSYGFGKGGYSEKSGSVQVTLDDPERNLSITVGYSQSHIKGGYGYYPGYLYGDPFYDSPRRPIEPVTEP